MNELNETIGIEALTLLEQGISVEEILRRYPGERVELASFLSVIADLHRASEKVVPTPELLMRSLERLPRVRTTTLFTRFFESSMFFRVGVPVVSAVIIFSGVFISTHQSSLPVIVALHQESGSESVSSRVVAPMALKATLDSGVRTSPPQGSLSSASSQGDGVDSYFDDFTNEFDADSTSQQESDATTLAAFDQSSDAYDQAFSQSSM